LFVKVRFLGCPRQYGTNIGSNPISSAFFRGCFGFDITGETASAIKGLHDLYSAKQQKAKIP